MTTKAPVNTVYIDRTLVIGPGSTIRNGCSFGSADRPTMIQAEPYAPDVVIDGWNFRWAERRKLTLWERIVDLFCPQERAWISEVGR